MDTTAQGPSSPPNEHALLDQRRQALFGESAPARAPRWAIALSGGGIRSATFSLGVLQRLAATAADGATAGKPPSDFRSSLLSRFDYLSTVSGGSYMGAFLCSLFKPGRLVDGPRDEAADLAVRVLASGPPGRIRSAPYTRETIHQAPLAWLRENGRYLVPTGIGDAAYAVALELRGWVALHAVLGILLVFVCALLALMRGQLDALVPALRDFDTGLLKTALEGCTWTESLWWSPLLLLALVPLLLWALPAGLAFWHSYRRADGSSGLFNRAIAGIGVSIFVMGWLGWQSGSPLKGWWDPAAPWLPPQEWKMRQWCLFGLAGIGLASLPYYFAAALIDPAVANQRARLTRWLSNGLIATLAVLLFAAVETVAQTLYLLVTAPGGQLGVMGWPAAVGGALVWLVRRGSGLVGKSGPGNVLAKLPLTTLAGVAGIVIFFLVAVFWSLFVVALLWAGQAPTSALIGTPEQIHFLGALAGVTLVLALLTGQFPSFINLSGLHAFYSARLTRAYLGASNGKRFDGQDPLSLSVAEPLANDDMQLADYWVEGSGDKPAALSTFAPLHIINVTLAKTVDPADQLVQRDRKGLPLAVMPHAFGVADRLYPLPKAPRFASEIEQPLSVGRWVGASGAAVSTGIGRATSLGLSLLLGAANVRLGIWWSSGQGRRVPAPRYFDAVVAAIGAVFRTQTYLLYEFRARFFGLNRRWQYLSDGGHFENMGLYELLRKERGVRFVLACDNGADPDYQFDDLANLIRLARIDLGVDVEVVSNFSDDRLKPVFGTPEQFRSAAKQGGPCPSALLLEARRDGGESTWIVLLKPARHPDGPADVVQYGLGHADFPQETTADQFFDEAQWESYRRLGSETAGRVLQGDVLAALFKEHIEAVRPR